MHSRKLPDSTIESMTRSGRPRCAAGGLERQFTYKITTGRCQFRHGRSLHEQKWADVGNGRLRPRKMEACGKPDLADE